MSDKIFKIIVVVAVVAVVISFFNSYLILSSTNNLQEKLVEQNEELESLTEEQNDQINQLQQTLDDTQSALLDLENKLETAETEYENQQDQIEQLHTELSQTQSNLEQQVEQALSQTPEQVYAEAHKSVVLITTPTGQGSGFLFGGSNIIVTNYHVVEEETEIEIQYFDGSRTNATAIGSDPYSDLSVLEVPTTPQEAKPLEFSNLTIGVGQQAVAIGNPLGSTDSLSVGYISQVNKLIDIDPIIIPVYQLDLTITFGSSGGPLLDMSGNLIGVTNAGTIYGLNYAIPLTILQRVIPELISDGEYQHPFVGVSIIALTPQLITGLNISNIDRYQSGLLITGVFEDYPAEQAGLTPTIYNDQEIIAMDIILALDGYPVLTIEDWSEYTETQISPGDTITLTVLRDTETISIEVTTTERPPFN
ncbi:MAG: trypsin-like peptidase domain-containing protein [Candidatus Bathyarchaeota archaeon]|nr:trypsin-like peptidase domain-containing protein [Candidatus Bathyarchaeota archaeon]